MHYFLRLLQRAVLRQCQIRSRATQQLHIRSACAGLLSSCMEQASSSSQLPELPDPLPNLPQEIQFRRLLQACQAQVQAQASSSHATAGGDAAGVDLQAVKLKHVGSYGREGAVVFLGPAAGVLWGTPTCRPSNSRHSTLTWMQTHGHPLVLPALVDPAVVN